MIITLILITFICVYIIGHSGIIFDLSKFIYNLTHKNKEWKYQMIGKPFNCYSCLSFWLTIIYSLIIGTPFIYSIAIGSLFGGIISLLIDKLLQLIFKIINKIE